MKRYKNRFYQTPLKRNFALKMRNEPTPAEAHLWKYLQNGQRKQNRFVRQKIILGYIVDFYTHDSRLAIEVDGESHYTEEGKKKDQLRTRALNNAGIYVLRFSNTEVIQNTKGVLESIDKALTLKGSRKYSTPDSEQKSKPGASEICIKHHIGYTTCTKEHKRR